MKSVLFLFVLVFSANIINAQNSLVFEEYKKSLGDLKEGDVGELTFSYKNISKEIMLVSEVIPQCGCTVASFDREPLLVQEKSSLTLFFDSKEKHGLQRKTVSILLENGERYVLVITANVISE